MEKLVAMVTRDDLAASGASTQISHPFCLNLTSRKFPGRISQSITQMGKQPQRWNFPKVTACLWGNLVVWKPFRFFPSSFFEMENFLIWTWP